MNEALIVHSGAGSEDIFFRQTPPHGTDWEDVYAHPEKLILDELLKEAHSLEPLRETDREGQHKMWVIQQKIRIRLRLDAKLALTGSTCPCCAQHPVDLVLKECLWCAEPVHGAYAGSRGSCFYLKACYDPKLRSWGLLYYCHHSHADPTMLWLAIGYRTRAEAKAALYPAALYYRWLEQKYNAHYWESNILQSIFDLDVVMNLNLPLNPAELEAYLREYIRKDMTADHTVIGYYLRDAIQDFERKERP